MPGSHPRDAWLHEIFAEPEHTTAFDPSIRPRSSRSPPTSPQPFARQRLRGRLFAVRGGAISEVAGRHTVRTTETADDWTIEDIKARLADRT
jgi:hypothetical protein